MDLDNPSYFSLAGGSEIYRRKMGNSDSTSASNSECSLSRQGTPPKCHNAISNRNHLRFLRSVSSTSADSNPELFILGEPRQSDIAPDLAFKHPASRSNSLKSNNTRVEVHGEYSALPTSEEAASELSGDEVFISDDSARYYNHSAVRLNNSHRRHSIGTFMGRERSGSVASSSKSFKEDFPLMIHLTSDGDSVGQSSDVTIDDHSLRHASYPRKRCPRCPRGTAVRKFANMDDILMVSLKSSEAATLWVEYFSSYFQQISKQANRKPFKIQYMSVEDHTCETEEAKLIAERAAGVKLQLVVLCPGFLDFISEYPDKCSNLGKLFLADRTLALLLGVSDNDLNELHKKVLPTYFQWQRLSVGQDQDENFTKEFLGQAMTILSRVWKQQSAISNQEKAGFSVSPKKIRQGQNSVFILLAYPLKKEDTLKVSIERNNELFEVKSCKRRNPYTIKISVPDSLTEVTAIVNILVEKNGSIVGSRPIKCESRLRELEQILRLTNNPVEFMCQTLGFNPANKEHLDNWLLQQFQRNLPAHFNLLANYATPFAAAVHVHKHSHEEYPTLLHFAAKFGFEKLAIQLLDCPGADVAYEVRNVYDMTPADIAEANGHSELASILRGYMSMNEFTNMYAKLKEMSLNSSKMTSVDEDSNYLTPKCIEDFYKICPAPRPVQPSPAVTPTMEYATQSGYMAMSTPKIVVEKEEIAPAPPQLIKVLPSPDLASTKEQKQPTKNDVLEDKVQKELLEIINDFKNNVHSISQVEKLVEEWRNRNDVQKSFKEKQEQLNEMRMKYERIQHEMKTAMKKSTPFERVKKLFARNKPRGDDKQDISLPVLTSPSIVAIQSSQRPISSLSTSSSGSSGRMSTISGSSLGDSGTHSDNEERKSMLTHSHNEDDFRNELNRAVLELNYKPVPAPKPVKSGGLFSHKYNSKLFETIEEKPAARPDTLPISEEYYIQFPPSNRPIPGVVEKSPNTEYMNVSAAPDTPEGPDYMNFKVISNR